MVDAGRAVRMQRRSTHRLVKGARVELGSAPPLSQALLGVKAMVYSVCSDEQILSKGLVLNLFSDVDGQVKGCEHV